MLDTVEWRWVDVDGSQSVVRFDQLTEALASESLPAFTLVWRTGWTDWFSANRVADLAKAFDAAHSAPITVIRLTPNASVPPAAPIERYQELAPGHGGTLLRPKRPGALSTVPPPPPPRPPGQRLPPPPPPPPPHRSLPEPVPTPLITLAPIRVRDVQPTLAGEEAPVRSPTLRPVGGMPPPPRMMPQAKVPVILEEGAELDVEVEDSVPGEFVPVEQMTPPPVPPPLQKPAVPPEMVATQPSTEAPRRSQKPKSVDLDLAGASRQAVTRATAIGVLLPGTLLLIAALVRIWLIPPPGADRTRTPAAASAPRPAAPPPGCVLARPAMRLAESAFVGVPVLVATAPGGKEAAIGFAATKEQARGITVEPASLATSPAFEQTVTNSQTLGVVPLADGKALEFTVDRMDPKFSYARTIDSAVRFTIGVTNEGLSRTIGPKVDVIWPGKSKKPAITTPRVASVPGVGHAVAFRHGGQEGKILVGWLAEDGAKQSELQAVGTDATLVGTPTISASDHAVLVTFASKVGPAEGWRLELGTAPRAGLPERAKSIPLPPGGPGGEAISPSSEELSGGRFLLQWTEGSAGNRAVRAQAMSANLVPIGEPVTLSTPEQNAGQGALWVHGSQALALFLVKKESSHELWGASLRCP